jgi:hypothetical protein
MWELVGWGEKIVVCNAREKKEIERKPSTDFEILLMTDG